MRWRTLSIGTLARPGRGDPGGLHRDSGEGTERGRCDENGGCEAMHAWERALADHDAHALLACYAPDAVLAAHDKGLSR
jgi:hypothetical protein